MSYFLGNNMDSGWKKILILTVTNAILILGIVFWSFGWLVWPGSSGNDLAKTDPSKLFPVTLGPNRVIASPSPAFYQERQLYHQKIKGLGFVGQTAPSSAVASAIKSATNPVQGAAQIISNSYLPAVLPKSVNSKLMARAEVFVFPPFYVKYLNEMQDIMAADGALKERRVFKTNDDVVLFLDDFYDYLIAKGIVPKSEESRLHSGIRRALQLLKDEAAQPKSYFNFPDSQKFTKSEIAPHYGLEAFLSDFSINPVKSVQAQTQVLGFTITPQMGQQAGKFIGNKLGGVIGGKLGKFIPGGIGNQIGNFVGSQIANQLGGALGNLFKSGPSAIDAQLRLQMEAEFGKTGSLSDALTSQQLNDLYGPTMGADIDKLFMDEMSLDFSMPEQSSFFGDLTKGLQDLLGSDFGKMLGDMFGKFNDLSSVFSNLGNLGNIGSLLGIGGGGSNLSAPCCGDSDGCRTPKGQPLGCLNKVCTSGPAIWDRQTKICGCGQGGGGGGGGGGAAGGGLPSGLGAGIGPPGLSGISDSLGGMFKDLAALPGGILSPQLAGQVGDFFGKQLGNFVGGQLGNLVPGGIASQIGNFLGGQLGGQLSEGLSGIVSSFDSGAMSSADFSSAVDAEFGDVGSSIDSQLREQLNAEYGPIEGQSIANEFSSEVGSIDSMEQAQFTDVTEKELEQGLESELAKEEGIIPVDCKGADCTAGQPIDPREQEVRTKLDALSKERFGGNDKAMFDAYAKDGSVDAAAIKQMLIDGKVDCTFCGVWSGAIVEKFDSPPSAKCPTCSGNGDGKVDWGEFLRGNGKGKGI